MTAEAEQHTEATERHGLEPWRYVQIGLALTLITVVELAISLWIDIGAAMIPVLIALSAVKFAVVLAFFMHLYFEPRLFTRVFLGGFVLGSLVLLALITLFWNDLTALG